MCLQRRVMRIRRTRLQVPAIVDVLEFTVVFLWLWCLLLWL